MHTHPARDIAELEKNKSKAAFYVRECMYVCVRIQTSDDHIFCIRSMSAAGETVIIVVIIFPDVLRS